MAIFWIFHTPVAVLNKVVQADGIYELHTFCNVTYGEILTEFVVSGPWVVLACIFTLLARNLPDNNYEARTAAFSANAAAVSATAFFLIYLGLSEPYQKQFYRFMGILLNAVIYLFCLHIVKIYSVYSVPLGVDNAGRRVCGVWRRNRAGTTSSTAPIIINRQTMAIMKPAVVNSTCNGSSIAVSSTASEDTRL